MKLSEQLSEFYAHSTKISDLVRSINYSLIALVWILSGKDTCGLIGYKNVILGILISLSLDFVHYCWLAINTFIAYKRNEKKYRDGDSKVSYPNYIEIGSWLIFFLKAAAMIYAVVTLLGIIR